MNNGTLEAPIKDIMYDKTLYPDEPEFESPLYWHKGEIAMVIDYWWSYLMSAELSIKGIVDIVIGYFVGDDDELGANFESMWKEL